MKPPLRRRFVPSRFAAVPPSPERPQRGAWGQREKRALLAALRAQAERGLSEQRLPAALREQLPRRSEAEIRALLVRLRGRAAREALTSKFRNFLRLQRQIRAPIQVWQDLTETLGGGVLEGPPSAAFSQVLTVAATEPLSLELSRPPQELGTPSPNSGPPREGETPSPNSGSPPNPGGLQVDFGRIYEFLARISAGGEGQPLPPAESAVVLALLGALPAELGALGALGSLQHHLRGVWGSLSAPRDPPPSAPRDPPPSAPRDPPLSAPRDPPPGPAPLLPPPLNPLLVPLGLLGRAG